MIIEFINQFSEKDIVRKNAFVFLHLGLEHCPCNKCEAWSFNILIFGLGISFQFVK